MATIDVLDASGATVTIELPSTIVNPSAAYTRPANTTQYTGSTDTANGDILANSVTAGSVTALSFANAVDVAAGACIIRKARMSKSTNVLLKAKFRLHLFSSAPTFTNGDNGVFLPTGVAAGYLGSLEGNCDRIMSDGAVGDLMPSVAGPLRIKLSSGTTIYGAVELGDDYTPGSGEVFTFVPEIERF